MDDDLPWQLVLVFTPLSLISLGGGQSVTADINKQVVDVYGWLTQADFVSLFAISHAAPGPGSLLSTLIGWRVDGFVGAVVASVAYFVPSSALVFCAARVWHRYRGRAWQGVF
jgi:chromate transporter